LRKLFAELRWTPFLSVERDGTACKVGTRENREASDVLMGEGEKPVVVFGDVKMAVDERGGVENGVFREGDTFWHSGAARGFEDKVGMELLVGWFRKSEWEDGVRIHHHRAMILPKFFTEKEI